ncbi:MAG: cystathionine gamma-synthase family protein [Planctomycetota bacterium]
MSDHDLPHLGNKELRPESLMMSYGYDPMLSEGALKSPIFQTSTFVFETAEAGKAFFELAYGLRDAKPNEELGLIYSRLNNPDLEILEDRLRLWDRADAAAVFESGMAAITTTILALVRPGDIIVHSAPIYGGSDHFLRHIAPEFGIRCIEFTAGDPLPEVDGKIALVFIETPANPTNALVDIGACAEYAHKHDAPLAVDNTFLGPLWQHPMKHGADLVIYSATKFIGGHSDVVAGACVGKSEYLDTIRAYRTFFGTMCGPWTGWLLMRSLETLKLRMTSQMKNARYVADFLNDHPKVKKVHYLGLITEEDEEFPLYKRQCLAPGSIIAFEVDGGEPEAFRFLNALRLVKLAVSLGGTESLAEHPATMTHSDIEKQNQAGMGITPAMVRISVGVEHPEDIIEDIKLALEVV